MVLSILAEYWYITTLVMVLAGAWYLGVFTTMRAAEVDFPGGTFFYHNLQTSASNLSSLYAQVEADVRKYVDTLPEKVPYPLAGIYYDDPGDLVDPDTMRVSVGFVVKASSDTVAEHFKRIGYEEKQLPVAKAVGVDFPMRAVNPL